MNHMYLCTRTSTVLKKKTTFLNLRLENCTGNTVVSYLVYIILWPQCLKTSIVTLNLSPYSISASYKMPMSKGAIKSIQFKYALFKKTTISFVAHVHRGLIR